MAGIYIHIPFCNSKCIYCNFYSVATLSHKGKFLEALEREMELTHEYLVTREISTLYFGGGTPSILSGSELESLIHKLEQYYNFDQLEEITLEANPEQLTPDYLGQIKKLGINRLSIGIQSFDDRILRWLKRGHSAEMAKKAIQNAISSGFSNISIDLIYGISGRTSAEWEKELTTAFSYPIQHLSAYALTVEENTLLDRKIKKNQIPPVEDQKAIEDFTILRQISQAEGFGQYEISNFSRHGYESRHNSSYWQDIPYLGLGPSAHSYNGNSRQWNVSNLNAYIEGMLNRSPDIEVEILTPSMKFNEYIMVGLRTCKGINLDFIRQVFGDNMADHTSRIFTGHIEKSCYSFSNNSFILTDQGKLWIDRITLELMI